MHQLFNFVFKIQNGNWVKELTDFQIPKKKQSN
jgi:hypothetical protein